MSPTLLSNRTDARRHFGRLHDFIARELPSELSQKFDPSTESHTLGMLGLILFVHQRWNRISPAEQTLIRNWLSRSAARNVRGVLEWSIALVESPAAESIVAPLSPWIQASRLDVFERVLEMLDPRSRRRHGFYCTPSVLAEFVVSRVNLTLIEQFGLVDGILANEISDAVADRRPLNFLDPAVGTGAFLSAIIKIAYQQFQQRPVATTSSAGWSTFVANRLLPRLYACDIQLAPLACAHIRLAIRLLRCGFDFTTDADLSLWHINPLATLDDSMDARNQPADPILSESLARFRGTSFSWIVGNPPYGAIQAAASPGMRKLMHGQCSGTGGAVDYFQSADGPIAERKTWLYDHYIQFLRFAQWRIQQAGGGVISFLTNRGFLQHVTMRGLRHQLLQAFDRIEIHDFQGGDDRSNRDHNSVHENVFGVRSGIALSVLAKLPDSPGGTRHVEWHVHRGEATAKLRHLSDHTISMKRGQRLTPTAPLFLFQVAPKQPRRSPVESIPLNECFIHKSSAIVTARDSLVIGFERAELLARIALLRDAHTGDEALRESLFKKSRGQKYPRGDTRGWKLTEARALLSADANWQDHVKRCSYRPLDDRYIYWHPQMIDWQRTAISKLMTGGDNPALIARRQTPDDVSANYFWITRWPTIDGIVRSDNRGNESVFPLWTFNDHSPYNLSDRLLELASRRLGVVFDMSPCKSMDFRAGDLADDDRLSGFDLFAYFVALAFSPSYRVNQKAAMRHDFIPIAMTGDEKVFRQLVDCGRSLVRAIGWHGCSPAGASVDSLVDADVVITKPKLVQRQIRIGAQAIADGVDEATWGFRAGSHQVCRKWLGDRAARRLTNDTQRQFANVLQSIQRLQAICRTIETSVGAHGGWDRILT